MTLSELLRRVRGRGAFGHVSRLAAATALAQAIQLLATPVLTRLFDVAAIGAWTLFTATAATLATVATARYEYAIVLPRRDADATFVLQLCLAVCAGVTLAVALAVLVLHWGWPGSTLSVALGASIGWLPVFVAVAGLMQTLTLWQNRMRRFERIAQARVATPLATTVLQFGSAAAQFGVAGLVAAQTFGALAGPLLLLRAEGGRAGWRLPRWSARRLWRVAVRHRQFPLVNSPHAFINALQETLAIGLVATLAGPVAAGHYGLMTRLVKAPASMVGGAVSEVLLGALARTWAAGGDIRPLLRRATGGLALVSLLPALVLLAAGPALFGSVLGADWTEAGAYAQWLVPYLMAHFIVGPLTVASMVIGRQGRALAFSVAGNALYVAALALVLSQGGSLAQAFAAVSVVQVAYFASYWIWLLRAARRTKGPHG